jgi:hypothetical protein
MVYDHHGRISAGDEPAHQPKLSGCVDGADLRRVIIQLGVEAVGAPRLKYFRTKGLSEMIVYIIDGALGDVDLWPIPGDGVI